MVEKNFLIIYNFCRIINQNKGCSDGEVSMEKEENVEKTNKVEEVKNEEVKNEKVEEPKFSKVTGKDLKKEKDMDKIENKKKKNKAKSDKKQDKEKGNNKCHQLRPVPVRIITAYKGIKVSKKFIPTNRHFESGNIYLGIYTLLIKLKLPTTLLIAKFEASLK